MPFEKIVTSKIFYSLIAFIIIAIVITFTLRRFTPVLTTPTLTTPLFTQNFDNSATPFANITFSGNPITTPENLYIVETSTNQTDLLLSQSAILKKLSVQPVSGLADDWENENITLSYVKDPGIYILENKNFAPSQIVLSKEQAALKAQEYIQNTLGLTNITPIYSDIQYYEAADELIPTNEFKANIIDIPFSYMIDSVPVFVEYSNYPLVRARVHGDYIVSRLTFIPIVFNEVSHTEAKPISIDQALENINKKSQATVLYTRLERAQAIQLDQQTTGQLNTVSLEYRFDGQTNILIPVYRFTGNLSNAAGQNFYAELITPAIETKLPATN